VDKEWQNNWEENAISDSDPSAHPFTIRIQKKPSAHLVAILRNINLKLTLYIDPVTSQQHLGQTFLD
jgi:hypothetical protein